MIMRMFLIVYALNPRLLFFSMIGAKCVGSVKKRKARVRYAVRNFAYEKRSLRCHQILTNQPAKN